MLRASFPIGSLRRNWRYILVFHASVHLVCAGHVGTTSMMYHMTKFPLSINWDAETWKRICPAPSQVDISRPSYSVSVGLVSSLNEGCTAAVHSARK